MTKVLVTGGAGFIGSHVCDRLLAEGHTVIAVDDLSSGRIANLGECRGYGKDFSFQNLDIRSDAFGPMLARAEPEVVIHLAAQPGVRPSMDDPRHDASINVLGLLNVLEAAVAAKVRKVVFSSSGGTIYGEPRKLPVKEAGASGAKPLSPYGISKKVAEDYLRFYQRYKGLDYTALALANVYGPRQDPHGEAGVVAIFARAMLAGTPPVIFGDGDQTRDFVFIDDTSHAFSLALDGGSGRLINIGTALETTVNEIAELLAGVTGFEEAPQRGPKQKGELRRISLDNGLAATQLGWKPWTHIEDGLAETVAYLRDGA